MLDVDICRVLSADYGVGRVHCLLITLVMCYVARSVSVRRSHVPAFSRLSYSIAGDVLAKKSRPHGSHAFP